MNRSSLGDWLNHREQHGKRAPGLTPDGKLTDETIDWILRERQSGIDARGSRIGATLQRSHVEPQIDGLSAASRKRTPDELWAKAIAHQEGDSSKVATRYSQTVTIPDTRPVLLVLLSDLHLGNAHTDYARAKADAELVRDTDGVYAALLGDLVDSWITPRLQHIQREQPFQYSDELALLESWLDIMRDKLIACVSGNHDLRTYEMAGLDLLGKALSNCACLYDQYEIRFLLTMGGASWRWKLRHNWVRKSQYNATHGMEWDSKFSDGTWDFAVGGHMHAPTVFREFFDQAHDHRLKLSIQLGSYQLDSAYGRRLGLPRLEPGGSAAIMLYPDGRWQPWRDLEAAARFLEYERREPKEAKPRKRRKARG